MAGAEHAVGRDQPTHTSWDAGLEPVARIRPGDVVHFETDDFAGGQITRGSSHRDLLDLDFDAIYPLAGPVYVEGAEPGDAVVVEVLELQPAAWGWACIIPGLGLLPREEFPDPFLKVFDLEEGDTAELCPGVRIPIEPFLGTMGLAPAGARQVPIPPPHSGGGNIDFRHLTAGATLRLPVGEPGGLFSAGDGHAAQGDGEVAISGIECAMGFSLRFGLEKGTRLRFPRVSLPPGSFVHRVAGDGWESTLGIGPDLIEAARDAVRGMIDLLTDSGLSREDSYVLCSLAGDLKITEVVDAPNWIVAAFMPASLIPADR